MSPVEIRTAWKTAARRQAKFAVGLAIVPLIIFGLAGVSPKLLGEIAAGFLCIGAISGRVAEFLEPRPSLAPVSSQDMRRRRR